MATGNCRRGDECWYKHDRSTRGRQPECAHFKAGNCRNGDKCHYKHTQTSKMATLDPMASTFISPVAPMASHNNQKQQNEGKWLIDSGANVFSTDPRDPMVMKIHDLQVNLNTTAGPSTANRATLQTPLGVRKGLALKGSSRIIPATEIARGGHIKIGKDKCEAIYKGIVIHPQVVNGIPRIDNKPIAEQRSNKAELSAEPEVLTFAHENLSKGDTVMHTHQCAACGDKFKHEHKILDPHWMRDHYFNCCESCLASAGRVNAWKFKEDKDREFPEPLLNNMNTDACVSQNQEYDDSIYSTRFRVEESANDAKRKFKEGKRYQELTDAHLAYADEICGSDSVSHTSAYTTICNAEKRSVRPAIIIKRKCARSMPVPWERGNRDMTLFEKFRERLLPLAIVSSPHESRTVGWDSGGYLPHSLQGEETTTVFLTTSYLHDGEPNTLLFDHESYIAASNAVMDVKSMSKKITEIATKLVNKKTVRKAEPFNKAVDLEKCEMHRADAHAKWDPHCYDCVRAALRSKPHFKQGKDRHDNPQKKLSFDLAVYEQSGPYCAIGIMTGPNNNPVIVVEPIGAKTLEEIKRALASIIAQMSFIWKCDPVTRVHGDLGKGLRACAPDLEAAGVAATFTQGLDPSANGQAERAVGMCADGARARLATFIDNGASESTLKALWPAAMIHAAQTISARGADPKTRIQPVDILPFGCLTTVRRRPREHVGKSQLRTYESMYLNTCPITPRGHVIAPLEKISGTTGLDAKYNVRAATVAVTLAPITKSTQHIFPNIKFEAARNAVKYLRVKGTHVAEGAVDSEGEVIPGEYILDPEVYKPPRRSPRLADAKAQLSRMIEDVTQKAPRGNAPDPYGLDISDLPPTGYINDLRSAVTRLAKKHEYTLPDALKANMDEVRKVLIDTNTLGPAIEEDGLDVGVEVAELGNILSLKDSETNHPEWRARVIFRGDCPKVVSGKDQDGRNRYSPVAENADVWSATTADHTAVRMALAYALIRGFETYTCDLASAYLQADAGGRPTYVKMRGPLALALPEEFRDQRAKCKHPVHQLQKALYGRKRSGFDWAMKLQGVLKEMNFTKCTSVNGIFYRRDKSDKVNALIACYVDDCIVAISSKEAEAFFTRLSESVKIKKAKDGSHGWAKASRFLGIEYKFVETSFDRRIIINMNDYTQHMLVSYEDEMGAFKAITRIPEIPHPVQERNELGKGYRTHVAKLLWLARCERAELLRAVCAFASCIDYWSEGHSKAFHNLMGYVSQSKLQVMVLRYQIPKGNSNIIVKAWCDASLAVPKSVTGIFVAIVDTENTHTFIPLLWSSKRQTVAGSSSTAAEFLAAAAATETTLRIADAAEEVGVTAIDATPRLLIDSQPLLQGISRGFSPYEAQFNTWRKSLVLRLCQLQDLQDRKKIKYEYVNTDLNVSDFLTKILDPIKLAKALKMANLVSEDAKITKGGNKGDQKGH